MFPPYNMLLLHRKIYDNSILEFINPLNLDTDNGINLFLTEYDNKFITYNYRDKISNILGYRVNYQDGSFSYLPLANYTQENTFFKPYYNYFFDVNCNIKQLVNVFNINDLHNLINIHKTNIHLLDKDIIVSVNNNIKEINHIDSLI